MSFNRSEYDPCAYNTRLKESTGIGKYYLETPAVNDYNCDIYDDPRIRAQHKGVASCSFPDIIDMSSELRGTSRVYTKCPDAKKLNTPCKIYDIRSCNTPITEDTRISNPPCTLRESGWNRWEWLPMNPQGKAITPFNTLISNRILVKDNHRPCILEPIDQTVFNPQSNKIQSNEWSFDAWVKNASSMTLPGTELLTRPHWRTCKEL
jgi:hypothetical protein